MTPPLSSLPSPLPVSSPSSLCFSIKSPKLLPFSSSCLWSVWLHTSPPLYFSHSGFYHPSSSLCLLSWLFSVATAVIHHENPVAPSPIGWTSGCCTNAAEFSGRQGDRKMGGAQIEFYWNSIVHLSSFIYVLITHHPSSTHASIQALM